MLLTESFKKHFTSKKKLTEAEKKYHYITYFNFKDGASVNDYDAASEYLQNDDMTQYLDDDLKEFVTHIEWVLDDEDSLHVDVYTNREITDEENKRIVQEIDGQNSDGLGEGFEQQDFAESYFNPDTGDGPYSRWEAENEITDLFDNMDEDDWIEYLDSDDIREGLEAYIRDGYYNNSFEDYLVDNYDYSGDYEDEDEFREHLENTSEEDLFSEYPEEYDSWLEDEEYDFLHSGEVAEYVDDNAVSDAKENAAPYFDWYDIDNWYVQASMEWDVPPLQLEDEEEPEEEKVEEPSNPKIQPPIDFDGPSDEDLKRIEEYRAKGWI